MPGPPPGPAPLLTIGAGLLASIAFSALLAWYMVKPIRYLRQAFDAAAAGNLDIRVQPLIGKRRDEIADLGRDYDRMADRLKELIEAQRGLFQDVSHELRSPLARLQAAAGLIRRRSGDADAAVDRVELEAGRLDELVGEILLLARLESGVPGAVVSEIDLIDLIEGIVEDACFEAELDGGRGCQVDIRGNGPMIVVGHADLLRRAIENVMRNAIRHTAPGTSVSVDLRSDAAENRLCLNICDRGPGIAHEAIFQPFYRVPGSEHFRGYGLGLAIARRAVEAHGGTIRASNRPGGGLKIEICLPLKTNDIPS